MRSKPCVLCLAEISLCHEHEICVSQFYVLFIIKRLVYYSGASDTMFASMQLCHIPKVSVVL